MTIRSVTVALALTGLFATFFSPAEPAEASNGASPKGFASSPAPLSGPVQETASQTLYVNKYSPNQSTTPGCENPDFTEIGSADPSFGAVGAAVSGDTIFICGSPTAATDPLTATTGPYIPNVILGTKSLTFEGDGPARTILDGQNDRTLIYADRYDPGQGNSYLNLEEMTIKRGRDINSGGGVEAYCRNVNVSNVHFLDNKAIGFGEDGGGGIYARRDGDCPTLANVTVTSSTFSGNVTEFNSEYGQSGSDGGAIFAYGTVTVTGSTFENNQAKATANSPRAPRGGAIAARGEVSVTDSSFTSNSVTGPRGFGGAVAVGEDAIGGQGISVTDSSFTSNSVTGPESFGGAIYAARGVESTIAGSTFAENSASSSSPGPFPNDPIAGAVRIFAADLSVANSTFTGNEAVADPAISGSDDVSLESVTSSGNVGFSEIRSGGSLRIGNSIIDEAGEACVAPTKVNLGGNVISNTTAATGDCIPFVGGGGGPVDRVAPSSIELQPLADNGGPTETMALGPTSVARTSAAVNLLGPDPMDQRGFARPLTNQASGAYQPIAPINTALPQISGTTRVGQTLTTTNGSWIGAPDPTFSYQWQRCEPIPAGTAPTVIADWGSFGSGNGQFTLPTGVAIDSAGNTYVADSGNNRIQKFDSLGQFQRAWGTQGSGNGQFNSPQAVAVDRAGTVYVADTGNDRIQKFTSSGDYLSQWGSFGTGNGQLDDPFGVAIDRTGSVYVVDNGNERIQRFNSSGTYLSQWGSPGSGNGQFDEPLGVGTDGSGNVYVADSMNSRIQKFTSSGTYLAQWGTQGSADGQFRQPSGVAIDPNGDVYVADAGNDRIQKFTSAGTYLTQWSSVQVDPPAPGQLFFPTGLTTNAAGDVYVADTNNQRIVGFDLFDCISEVAATGQTYELTAADVGKNIRVSVTAIDPAGSQIAFSNLTDQVEPDPPPPPTTYVLAVNKSVSDTGTGTVTSNPAGINCGTNCQQSYDPGTQVTLTATPDPGSRFTGWTGACTNQEGPCPLTMTDTRVVTARFTAVDTYRLTVQKQGTGQGTVTSSPSGIDCGTTCESSFDDGTEVTLTASAAEGSAFTGWSGACSGTTPCQVTMDQARQVTATFEEAIPSYSLTVTKQGTGQGTVTSNPSGINCGAACEASYEEGTEVTLTASAASGSTFTGWSGACSGTGPCQVTMSQARQVTGSFGLQESDVRIQLNTSKPATIPPSRVVGAVRVSCEGGAPCQISSASARARAGKGKSRNALVSFPAASFPAGTNRLIRVTIPRVVYDRLRKGIKSGLLIVDVRARGTEGPKDRTLRIGLER